MPGDRVPWEHYTRTAHKEAIRRWRVDTGDVHSDHHVTLLKSPDSPPEWRWLVYSSLWSDRELWGYPTPGAAMEQIDRLEDSRQPWRWTEIPPTPYDTELGTMPADEG